VIPPILKPSVDAESERKRDEHGKRRRGRRNGGIEVSRREATSQRTKRRIEIARREATSQRTKRRIEVARRESMSQRTKRGKKMTSGLRNPL